MTATSTLVASTAANGRLTENGMAILKKRYFHNGEDWDGLCRRVAGGDDRFERLIRELRFVPNSPTLFNAGLNNGCTLSACFTFDVEDTMLDSPRGILPTRNKAAAVAKAGGGVGYWLGDLRPKGSPIKSVHRKACGPVSVLRDYHGLRSLITQGGKRDLAQMAVLPCWHEDIREFIHAKDEDPQGLSSFNISVSWDDKSLQSVHGAVGESSYVADCSFAGRPVLTSATDLWREQVDSAWRTGDPGTLFADRIQKDNWNPHLGLIRTTNPCGEVPNRSDEPCNLGSLNVACYFMSAIRGVDLDRLADDAYYATLFLDDVLDRNVFPHPDITRAAGLSRRLGLGVMGWADLLALMQIHYDTEQAVSLARTIMSTIKESGRRASADLGRNKGPYAGFCETRSQTDARRNETTTSIAPTGTISIIAGASSGIEPHFALEWQRTTYEGMKMMERIPVWDRLDGFVPKVASEIAPEWHVRHQAAFQEFTDLGVSKTVNLPNSATRQDVSDAYKLMWTLGCKGGTVFRDGCRSEQVLVAKKAVSVYTTNGEVGGVDHACEIERTTDSPPPSSPPVFTTNGHTHKDPDRLPKTRSGCTHRFRVGGVKGYLTANTYPDGRLAEIFLRVSKQGSTTAGLLDTWAMCFSNALQSGKPLAELVCLHAGSRFEPSGLTDDKDIPMCSSIPDYVVRWLELKFIKQAPPSVSPPEPEPRPTAVQPGHDTSTYGDSGLFCPDCGRPALYTSGCLSCSDKSCGWSKCG